MKKISAYIVSRLKCNMDINADWDKSQWQNLPIINISNYMGEIPVFHPLVQAKMMYDDENLFVIFRVNDRYVRCLTKDINGPVWKDSCVEFFFSPDSNLPEHYFNLEINCGGTPLMHYNIVPGKDIFKVEEKDIKKIEIAYSMPQIINPEISEQVNWTVEYRIPLDILQNYSQLSHPKKGVIWRGNFYKIAENNSNPHYITWAAINNNKPDFHLPQFFGLLKFE